jgi:uncharacterized protein YceK
MQNKFNNSVLAIVCGLMMCLSGCSTVTSAYDSTVDTVSGWFKSDDKKK